MHPQRLSLALNHALLLAKTGDRTRAEEIVKEALQETRADPSQFNEDEVEMRAKMEQLLRELDGFVIEKL